MKKSKSHFLLFTLSLSAAFTFFTGCPTSAGSNNTTTTTTESSTYKCPKYKDNYTSFSSWENKDSWNLANVHDPSVVLWNGTYYMWGTDASYGNAHENASSGKHFQGKYSENLVDWSWLGGPFDSAPSWVVEKLNEIRATMKTEKDATDDQTEEGELEPIEEDDISFGFWAPCARVITVDGVKKIRMYYSIVIDNYIKTGAKSSTDFDGSWGERAFIGVCETTNPTGLTVESNTTKDLSKGWVDLGFVVCSSSDLSLDYSRASTSNWSAYFYFNAIDPTYFVDDDGSHYLVYGSWHSGFALVRINPSTGKVAAVDGTDYLSGNVTGDFTMGNPWASSADGLKENGYGTRIYTRSNSSRWQASEGPELVKYNGYYYLFFANDALDIPYQTRVVRASNIAGPYYDLYGDNYTGSKNNGSPLPLVTHPYHFTSTTDSKDTNENYGWVGISHCAIFQNADGDWFYMSQARFPTSDLNSDVSSINAPNAVMMGHVRRLVWVPSSTTDTTDLWPVALPERYGAYPDSEKITESELYGTWSHISLYYTKGKSMNTSETLYLNDDHSVGGDSLSGTWSFDEENQYLTIVNDSNSADAGKTVTVKLEREVNWERKPRKVTIVYAGTSKELSTKTYWGKKISDDQEVAITLPYTVEGDLASGTTVKALGSDLINSETGLSLSFSIGNTYTSDWTQIFNIGASDGTDTYFVGLSLINHWKNKAQVNYLMESQATASNDGAWNSFCNTAAFATISFNTDGTITYYKDGELIFTYAADTAATLAETNGESQTVSEMVSEIISYFASNGATTNFAISDLVVSTALSATEAEEFFTEYGVE